MLALTIFRRNAFAGRPAHCRGRRSRQLELGFRRAKQEPPTTRAAIVGGSASCWRRNLRRRRTAAPPCRTAWGSKEHTSELQSHLNLVSRLLLDKTRKDTR